VNFDSAADELERREKARIFDTVTPRLETFKSMTLDSFTAEIALLKERLGYSIIATAPDLAITKDGKKYIVACATPANGAPTQTRELARLHDAVVKAKAHGGFYVTPHSFTPDAEHYAASAPIVLVDGTKLIASMKKSRAGLQLPDTYKAMCRDCGCIVQHRLDRKETLPCENGHPVAPTIARATVIPLPPTNASSTATTPRRQPMSRRQIKAHNYKLRARMTKKPRVR
jgi:hypothetical protein